MLTRTRRANVPPGYDASTFPAFAVTVDVVILTMADGVLHVLLVRRGQEPYKGMWAIPGGFGCRGDTGRGGETRALRGDGRRRPEPADPVRRLRRSRTRPAHERRHGRVPRRPARRRGDRRRHRRSARRPRPRRGRPRESTEARVRPPANRPTQWSASGSGSRSRASRRPSSARPSRWPSSGPCTRRSGVSSSTPRTSAVASWARTVG